MEIKEGYDLPADIRHESKNWWGLTNTHFGLLLVAALLIRAWQMICVQFGYGAFSSMVLNGGVVIAVLLLASVALKLDKWVIRLIRWKMQPFQMSHDDKQLTELSGIVSIDGDHFTSTSGKVCAIMKMTAIGNNRVDPEHHGMVLAADRDFLNSLPCPVQFIGWGFDYDIQNWINHRLKGSDRLSPKAHAMKINNLNFYSEYVKKHQVRDKAEFMVIGVDVDRSDPLDELDTNVEIIIANLATSGVAARRLHDTEIAAVTIMMCTGVGASAMDYMSPYMKVRRE